MFKHLCFFSVDADIDPGSLPVIFIDTCTVSEESSFDRTSEIIISSLVSVVFRDTQSSQGSSRYVARERFVTAVSD